MLSIKKLQLWLSKNEIALPGKIRTVRLKCGKKDCRCQSGKDSDKHGPYHFWDRKVKGKLTSSSVPESELKKFHQWIKKREDLEKIIVTLKEESESIAKKTIKKVKERSKK